MSTKMKGLLKGLRYISQIFDEEKEQAEMQIGLPTDVKHVAHIGCDGPVVQESHAPSWMKEFSSSPTGFSAPLGLPGDTKDNPEIKWVSEDSKRGQRTKHSQGKDHSEGPKSSRRQSSTESNSNDPQSPKKKDPSAKPRQSRKKEGKDSSETGVKSSQEPGGASLDVPKKPRRKKSKELVNDGGSRRSRNRATTSNGTDASTDQSGTETELALQKANSQLSTAPSVDGQEKQSRVTFKE